MTKRKSKTLFSILLILVGAAAFVLVKSYVFSRMGDTIIDKLNGLKVSGFNVQYDSIHVDWRKNTVNIERLVLKKNAYDTTCLYPEYITVGKIHAEGFRLIPLLFWNTLSFEKIHLEKPHLVLRQNSLFLLDSATQRENEFTLIIDNISLASAHIEYTDSIKCGLINEYKGHLSMAGLTIDFHVNDPFVFKMNAMVMDSIQILSPKDLYTFQIQKTKIDFAKGTLQMDSLLVLPDIGKLEFGRKSGRETDRFEGVIPFVRLSGFSFSLRDSIIRSDKAEVKFYLKIFRDKRLPFKNKIKLMPVAALQSLPFTILMDTLKITKSFVQYEEFAEEAKEPGGVYFDNLYAVISNLKTNSPIGNTQLVARASLMGQGKVELFATIPWEPGEKTQIEGTLQNFEMTKINAMLQPTTNIKVESGNMEKLSFKFAYNEKRSDGEIELNYQDLKLTTFKEEANADKKDKKEDEKDNLKTFILNTFIIRKNMDEKVPEDKRTGTVSFIRDNRKSIFNYWVKSLMSGIKSAYNLDKIVAQKNKREIKKEEKITKRQARKERKAAKKRERG